MQAVSGECPACGGPLELNASGEPRYEPCPACDCRVLVPKPSADEVAGHYSRMFHGGNYRVSVEHGEATARKFKHLLDGYLSQFVRLGLPRPKSVLDIGCFTGEFLDAAAAAGLETSGFDTMTEAIATIGRRHRVWSGDLRAGPEPDRQFDLVTLNDVLEHLSDVNDCMDFAATRLAPRGLLLMTTPATDSWAGRLLGHSWGVFDKREHLVLFGRQSVRRLLERHGLRVLGIKTHWKSLTLSYVGEMAMHWQFGSRARLPIPAFLGRLPLRVNVGEMLVVATR